MSKKVCEYCDEIGGEKTFRNQVSMPLYGKVQCIDHCIHHIVAALNAGGVRTVASCCGHRQLPYGRILLEDGRNLIIVDDCDQLVWQAGEQKAQPLADNG